MQIFKSLGIGLSFLLLPVCASAADGEQRAGLQMVSADELPAPTLADLQASNRPYRVGPFDKLTIDVFGSEELSNKEVQVDASGRITFPDSL